MSKRVGFMMDIESLDLGPNSVVTQIAFVAYDLDDPEIIYREVEEYLPIQPQIALSRTINADTIIWWMQQDDKARARFEANRGSDMEELIALVGSVATKMAAVIEECSEYEVWARGPQFDMVNVESLMLACGVQTPWKYDRVRDLRTVMELANVHTKDIPLPAGLVQHVALSDCKYQIVCLTESLRALRRS